MPDYHQLKRLLDSGVQVKVCDLIEAWVHLHKVKPSVNPDTPVRRKRRA